ncbi:MAG: hypothetical protein IKX79_01060, partial [Desulfovibrionaceae bacterium]|nr:hypothetical protein [Desulfovibrionaceae bacterium]
AKYIVNVKKEPQELLQKINFPADLRALPLESLPQVRESAFREQAAAVFGEYEARLAHQGGETLFDVFAMEEAMQKFMDEYAGGIRTGYRYNESQLAAAEEQIAALTGLAKGLRTEEGDGLVRIYELTERLTVCRTLLAHMRERKETRWPGFGIHTDYPQTDGRQKNYVNSKLVGGQIEILRRALIREDSYEHTH